MAECHYSSSVLIGMKIGTGSSAKVLRFSYDAGGNVVAVDYSSNNGSSFTTYYYLRNAQNDVIKLIDGSGNTVVEYTYDSWGKIVSAAGSLITTLGTDQPFRYRGYVYDYETQWYYLQSRYYDPATCRFISADVLLSTGQGVIGHNSFAYCLNNPATRIDMSGCLSSCFSGKVIDIDGDGIIDGYRYEYTFQSGFLFWKTEKTGYVYILLKELDDYSEFEKDYSFDSSKDIIIIDKTDGNNPTLLALQAHRLKKECREGIVDIMLLYCEEKGVDWGRTKDSLLTEWKCHHRYRIVKRAQDIDFDRNEEGCDGSYYFWKAFNAIFNK